MVLLSEKQRKKSTIRKLKEMEMPDDDDDSNPRNMIEMPNKKKFATLKNDKLGSASNTDAIHKVLQLSTAPKATDGGGKSQKKLNKLAKFKSMRVRNQKRNKERKLKDVQEEEGESAVPQNVEHVQRKTMEAREYLETWKNNRSEWKFRKLMQVFLIKHWKEETCVPDDLFPVLLEYFDKLRGNARSIVAGVAQQARHQFEEESAHGDTIEASNVVRKRAQLLLSVLEET